MIIYSAKHYEIGRPNENVEHLLSYLKQFSDIKFTSHLVSIDNLDTIENDSENYILISSTSIMALVNLNLFIQALRKKFGKIKCKVVVGGAAYYFLNDADVLKYYPEITHICVGKGEEVLKAIIEQNLPSGVYRAEDFNRVSAYTLCPEYPVEGVVMINFRDSRCSWNKCVFCHQATKCVYPSKNAQDVANEVMYYMDQFGYKLYYFFDNETKPEMLTEFLEILYNRGYIKKFRPQFYVLGLRVDSNIESLRSILKKCPKGTIYGIALGIEFYNQEILDRYKKGITTEQIDKALKFFPKFGTKNDVYLLFGLPTVTNKHIKDQEDFIKKSYPLVSLYKPSYFLLSDGVEIKNRKDDFKIKELDYNYTVQDFFRYSNEIPPIRTNYIDFLSWDDDLNKYASRDETFLKYLTIYKKFSRVGANIRLLFLKDKTHRLFSKIRPDAYFDIF